MTDKPAAPPIEKARLRVDWKRLLIPYAALQFYGAYAVAVPGRNLLDALMRMLCLAFALVAIWADSINPLPGREKKKRLARAMMFCGLMLGSAAFWASHK